MNIELSIIIPTYNRVELLRECLDSVMAQYFYGLEVVVTDDNSIDETENVVRQYQKNHGDWIKYVKNTKYTKGPNGNKNNGFDHAVGQYLTILDDDDTLISGALQLMLAKLNEGYDVVWGNCRILSDDKTIDNTLSGKGKHTSGAITFKELVCGELNGEFLLMMKNDLIADSRFDTDLYGGECTLWKRIFKNKKMYYIHKPVRNYRIYGQNITSNMQDKSEMVIKNYERDIEIFGEDMERLCPCYLAGLYKVAAYHAKMSAQYIKAIRYIFKGLSISFRKDLIIMSFVIFFPKSFVAFLLSIKEKIQNNNKI